MDADVLGEGEGPSPAMPSIDGGNPVATPVELHALLWTVARWQARLGHAAVRPFANLDPAAAPPELQGGVRFLRSLSYGDLDRLGAHHYRQVSGLPSYLKMLTDRERIILFERLLPERPSTLQTLGRKLGISHQRVAQLERDLRLRIAELTASGSPVGDMIDQLLRTAGPLCPVERLVALEPAMGALVPDTEIPVWRLVDRAVDRVEIRNGWLAAPSIDLAIATSQFVLRELEIVPGVSDTTGHYGQFGFTPEQRSDWARQCGYASFQDLWVLPAGNVADALVQALTVSSGPQTALELGDLLALMGDRRGTATIRAALRVDPRFAPAGDDKWHLASEPQGFWSVIRAIREVLDHQGPTPLAEILPLADGLGVSQDSLRFYAGTGLYQVVDGTVSYREQPQPTVLPPEEAPDMVRLPGGWAFLTTLSARAMDAQRLPVSCAVPALLGMEYRSRREFAEVPGAALHWEFARAAVELPAALVRHFRVGERVLIRFGEDTIQLLPAEPEDPESTGWAAALNALGQPSSSNATVDSRALARCLGLPTDARLDRLIDTCRRKRQWNALAALEAMTRP